METLAEFGAVDFFSINTLTTGIYNSWITFDDLAFSKSIILFLINIYICMFCNRKFSRKRAKYHFNSRGGFKQKEKITLSGNKSLFAFSFCFVIFFLSFYFLLLKCYIGRLNFQKTYLIFK